MDDLFITREGVFTEEKYNICNLPRLATIEIHRSKETGKFYLHFIEHVSKWDSGVWQDQEINETMAKYILSSCYPEHITKIFNLNLTEEG